MGRDDQVVNYLQGRLDEGQRRAFEADIAADPALAAEIEVLQAARQLNDQDTASHGRDMHDGWARLDAAIGAEAAAPAANDNAAPWKALAKAACIAVVSIGLWQFAVAPRLAAPPQAEYAPASQSEGSEAVLQVIFTDSAPAGQIAALIYELGGTVIDGPGAIGLYRIAFEDAQSRADAAVALAARPDLVASVTEN